MVPLLGPIHVSVQEMYKVMLGQLLIFRVTSVCTGRIVQLDGVIFYLINAI